MDNTNENVGSPAAPVESAPTTEQASAPAAPAIEEGQEGQQPQPVLDKPAVPRIQKRIDQLTRERYDEQRRAEAAEAQLAQYQRQQAITQQFSQLDAQTPQIDKFTSLHDYQMAMANWTTQRAAMVAQAQWDERQQAERAQQAQQYAQMAAQQQRIAAENVRLDAKLAEGTKKYPDFQQAVMNPDLPSVRGSPLMEIILESEHAVDVAYALAKNPAELERLLALPPAVAAREVYRMDTKFGGNGPTSAPPPPPSRNGSATGSKDPAQMSDAEFARWRKAQIAQRR